MATQQNANGGEGTLSEAEEAAREKAAANAGAGAGAARDFAEYGPSMSEAAEFVNSCNSFSELVDRLCIENVRLWHILDDTAVLKRRLEALGDGGEGRTEILEEIAKKSFENIESVKRRSMFKRAIDEALGHSVRQAARGDDPNVCIESKSYGRDAG